MTTSTCPRCGDEFEQLPGSGKWRKYCRPNCDWLDKECETCGDTFHGSPTQRFCSQPCRYRAMALDNSTNIEAQRSRAKRGGAVRAAQLSGTAKANTYLKVDNVHEHRTVAERLLGRPLEPGEVVHHEDRNRHNNDPANLIVFPSQAVHARHHKLDHCGKECTCPGTRLKEVMPR